MRNVRNIGFTIVSALIVSASVAEAQRSVAARDVPPGQRPLRGMCRIWIDGLPPGQQPAPTDCATARATAPGNSRIIYGDLTPFPGRAVGRTAARDCVYERSTTTIGDIIFGRRASDRDVICRVRGERVLGAWYEIGRDANGNVIYQRRVRLADGTIVLQRARRTGNGSFVIFDTRFPRSSIDRDTDTDDDDRRWARAERKRAAAVRRANARAVKEARKDARRVEQTVRKEERRATKAVRKDQKRASKAARKPN